MTLKAPFSGPVVRYPLAVGVASLMVMLMVGCGVSAGGREGLGAVSSPSPGPFNQTVTIAGVAHGGQKPVAGATIQLYVAGQPVTPATGGFGQGATSLLTPGAGPGKSNNYWPATSPNTGNTCLWTTDNNNNSTNTNNCSILPQTSSNGSFNITGDYSQFTCPSTDAQMYLVGTGGNPTGSGTVNNTYIALMAALGPCSKLGPSTIVVVNEVTTVGAVWALQQFMAAPNGYPASAYTSQGGTVGGMGVNVGASSGPAGGYGPNHVQSQVVGLTNAFTMVNNLVNNATGLAGSSNPSVTTNATKINAIANALAACVNTDGLDLTTGPGICKQLMTAATYNLVEPHDTIQAAWMMAQNPSTSNASNLLAFTAGISAPFQPALSSQTANLDLTLEVGLNPTFSSPNGAYATYASNQLAIDENGHAWIYSASGNGNTLLPAPFLAEVSINGSALAGPFQTYTASGGFSGNTNTCTTSTQHTLSSVISQMAIDQNAYLWVSNYSEAKPSCTNNNSLMRINTTNATTDVGYYYGDTGAGALVVDGLGSVWSVGYGERVMVFAGASSVVNQSNLAIPGVINGGTVDMLGNVWLDAGSECTAGSIANSAGVLLQIPATVAAGVLAGDPTGLDEPMRGFYTSGNTNCTNGTQTTAALQGNVVSLAADANNGIWAVDGGGSIGNAVSYFAPQSAAWTSAVASGSIPLTGALTTAAGLGGLIAPTSVAVDGANHAWVVSKFGVTGGAGNGLSEFSVSLDPATGNILGIYPLSGTSGFIFPSEGGPYPYWSNALAVDPSGNIWMTSSHAGTSGISIVVGAATPVVTPIAYQTQYGLIGSTVPATLQASSSSLAFSSYTNGTTSPAQSVTLTNNGTVAVSLAVAALSGTNATDFTFFTNTCSTSLEAGDTCSFSLKFTPGNTGTRTAKVQVSSNLSTTPLTISLAGTGVTGTIVPTPSISPGAGLSYSTVQMVTISDSAYGAAIYYTLDGSNPATSAARILYTQPFLVAKSTTVMAVCVATSGYTTLTSAVASASYMVDVSSVTTLATLPINTSSAATAVGKSFLGLSINLGYTNQFLGVSDGTVADTKLNGPMLNLLSYLTKYANGPMLVRQLNTSPVSTWDPSYLPVATAFFNSMKASSTYGVRYWFGLDLPDSFNTTTDQGCGSYPSATSAITIYANCQMAQDAYTIATTLPSGSLLGFELGNEPDRYAVAGILDAGTSLNGLPWTDANFAPVYEAIVPQLKTVLAGIPQSQSALPAGNNGAVLGSLTFACDHPPISDEIGTLLQDSAVSNSMSFLNLHWYPSTNSATDALMTSGIINTGSEYSTIPYLTSTTAGANGQSILQQTAGITNWAGLHPTVRLGEFNSIAPGTAGVGDRFQSALWFLDQSLREAVAGVDGINIWTTATNEPANSPFEFSYEGQYPNATYGIQRLNPLYYGMMLLQQFLQNNAQLLATSPSISDSNVITYTSLDASGHVRVLLINKDESNGGDVTINLSGHSAASLTYLQATNNNYLASDYTNYTTGDQVSIGGQTFKNSVDGTLQGTQVLPVVYPSSGTYTIPLAQASAVLVTIP